MRANTLEVLQDFSSPGGKIIIAGSAPDLLDAEASTKIRDLRATSITFSKTAILSSLREYRDVRATLENGSAADSLLYQMRIDGDDAYVFFCNTDRQYPRDVSIDIRGKWNVTLLDTMTAERRRIESEIFQGSWTRFSYHFDGCASLLLHLTPRSKQPTALPLDERPSWKVREELQVEGTSLSEPNVLLLDMARYRIDDEQEWSSLEEILRTDNIARKRLGLPLRQDNLAQPYRVKKVPPKHTIHLLFEFTVDTSVPIKGAQLALEGAASTKIELDGNSVPSQITGWWVDESIETVALPELPRGTHLLQLSIPYGQLTNIERVYVLGNFGVTLHGRDAKIVDFDPPNLKIGDFTQQGLPFYAGDVRYEFTIRGGPGRTAIQVPQFAAPLLRVELDGKPAGPQGLGKIAFQPHTLDLGILDPKRDYKLSITAVGCRDHAFGAVHLPDGLTKWYGPDTWRTNGDKWAYEYTIRKAGLLTAPRLLTAEDEFASRTWDAGSIDQDLWFH